MGKKRIVYAVLAGSLLLNCMFVFAGCMGSWDFSSFFQAQDQGGQEESYETGVADAASQTGFENTNTFIRSFKKYCGITPGRYKELQHRE